MSANNTAMMATLQRQRDAFTAARPEPMSVRKDRLKRVIAMMKETKPPTVVSSACDCRVAR